MKIKINKYARATGRKNTVRYSAGKVGTNFSKLRYYAWSYLELRYGFTIHSTEKHHNGLIDMRIFNYSYSP